MKSKALTLLTLTVFTITVKATILNVPFTYPTIQSAINLSSNGDTIVVLPGTYFENLNFRGKNVLLTSLYYLASDTTYISSTVINGSTPVNPDTASCVIFNSGEDSTAILQGFTITGGSGTKWLDIHGAGTFREGGGILMDLCSPTIRHNVITNNLAINTSGVVSAGGGGIRIGDGNPGIYSNVISFNQGRYGPGIVLNYSGCKIKNNVIFSNSGGQDYFGGSGIWMTSVLPSVPKIIENNTIIANQASVSNGTGGILIWSATNVFIRNNIVRDNLPAVQIKNVGSTAEVTYNDVTGGYTGSGNIDQDPGFEQQNYYLGNGSPCIDAGDSSLVYDDRADPGNPGSAFFPSKGLLRNDMGAYGGPMASLFPAFGTITGIHEIQVRNTISVFPNPVTDQTTIKTGMRVENATLRIFNALGQEVQVVQYASGNEFILKRGTLQTGIYLLQLSGDGKMIGWDIIIVK